MQQKIINRRKTHTVQLGSVKIGGDAPIVVQSMTSTDTRNIVETVSQIKELEDAGCEIIRVAIPDKESAFALSTIKKQISIPIIADIHFDYRLALMAIKNGADGIRINPGNIAKNKIREIIKSAKEHDIAIRIGVNSGSLEKDLILKHGGPNASALVESAIQSLELIREMGFNNLKLSIKSSDVNTMIEAYRKISKEVDCPLHLGVTEAGTLLNATIKSSIGIGVLLHEGIGDTIRVSITGDPVSEVIVAYGILRALNIRRIGPDIISCPTCARCEIDLFKLTEEVEKRLKNMKTYLKIALMGCVVNGPGEASEADVGIAGGRGFGFLFKKGKLIRKVNEKDLITVLIDEIKAMDMKRKE